MGATIAKAFQLLRGLLYSDHAITVMSKDLSGLPEPRENSRIEVTELRTGHLGGLSELNRKRGRSSVDRRFRSNLDRGLRGFVGFVHGDVVAYYWWVEAAHRGCATISAMLERLGA